MLALTLVSLPGFQYYFEDEKNPLKINTKCYDNYILLVKLIND